MSILRISTLRRCISCIPQWMTNYSLTYMDTIPKLIGHLLPAMAVCNAFLFIASFRAAISPTLGLDETLLVSFLLSFQNTITWIIIHNRRLPRIFHALAPTEFMLGITLGIAVGGSILAFVLSLCFGRMSRCLAYTNMQQVEHEVNSSPVSSYEWMVCEHHRGLLMAIWFWSGIVFWLNTAIALLIAMGRDELTSLAQSDYETIGISLDEFESSFQRYHAQQQQLQEQQPPQQLPPQFDSDFVQVE